MSASCLLETSTEATLGLATRSVNATIACTDVVGYSEFEAPDQPTIIIDLIKAINSAIAAGNGVPITIQTGGGIVSVFESKNVVARA